MKTTTDYIHERLKNMYMPGEIRSIKQIILSHVCGMSLNQQILCKDTKIQTKEKERIIGIVERLEKMEPIQYILGETEFYSLPIHVNPAVLIPRPETEELVDMIIKYARICTKKWNILDIGTGSGCIAIALKKHIPHSEVSAIDISEKALQTAQENAKLNGTDINFIQADILDTAKTAAKIADKYDIIVSNPPYVKNSEKTEMCANVLDYEPHLALFVPDDDALRFYKAIADFAKNKLAAGGRMYFEINAACSMQTANMFREKGFKEIETIKDLAGKERFISMQN